jgi:hypothetical protein
MGFRRVHIVDIVWNTAVALLSWHRKDKIWILGELRQHVSVMLSKPRALTYLEWTQPE